MNAVSFRGIDDLETSLIESWREVSQATHRFLVLLREFDLRQGWKAYGNNDCAEWLNWRCGISRVTAQEKVRVARILWGLPQIDEAFAQGALSYSKVRALCRVANEASETELLDFALGASAAQVEAYCRRLRNGQPATSAVDAKRLHDSRSLVRNVREDGSGTLTVELPQVELELVLAALDRIARTLPDDPTRSLFAAGADALVRMAEVVLNGDDGRGANVSPHRVVVHVDASALSGVGGESDLPLPTVRRLCCDGAVAAIVEGRDGEVLDVGRQSRLVPTALKRALFARDRGCTFPGCHHTRHLDAHHIEHWADGGETNLGNLLVLCTTHHKLVHEGGFDVKRDGHGRYFFTRPDGRPVEFERLSDRVTERRAVYRLSSVSAEYGGGFFLAGVGRQTLQTVMRL